jgi:hypothetical protein
MAQQPRATIAAEFRDGFLAAHPFFFGDVSLGVSAVTQAAAAGNGAVTLTGRDGLSFTVERIGAGPQGHVFRFYYSAN